VPLAASKSSGQIGGGLYGDAVEEIDDSTGKVLDTAQELNIDGQHAGIFTSDNGRARKE